MKKTKACSLQVRTSNRVSLFQAGIQTVFSTGLWHGGFLIKIQICNNRLSVRMLTKGFLTSHLEFIHKMHLEHER